jgi:hypothetical protein
MPETPTTPPTQPPKKEEPADETVKVQLDIATATASTLMDAVKEKDKEITLLKTKLLEVDSSLEAGLTSQLKLAIKHALDCDDTKLRQITEKKTLPELKAMLDHISLLKADAYVPYTSIKAGDVTPEGAGLTVGNLFGLKREDILKLKGE